MFMKKQLMSVMLAGLLAVGGSGLVQAAPGGGTRVAVLDSQVAVFESDAAKAAKTKLQGELKPQYDKADQLRRDIKALDDKYQKEVATMSEKDKKALRAQQGAKVAEFQNTLQLIQKRGQETEQDMLNKLLPSYKAIVDELRKSGEYDIILDRRSAIYFAPETDLTKKVTDRLNAVK